MSVRYNLVLFCPETDGPSPKLRIRYEPEGVTRKEQAEDIVLYAYENLSFLIGGNGKQMSQLDARRISRILTSVRKALS